MNSYGSDRDCWLAERLDRLRMLPQYVRVTRENEPSTTTALHGDNESSRTDLKLRTTTAFCFYCCKCMLLLLHFVLLYSSATVILLW